MFCILYLCHKNNIQFFPVSFERPSIHPSIFFHFSFMSVSQWGWIPAVIGWKPGHRYQFVTQESHSHSVSLLFPINLVCMSLGYGRTPEYPGRTHASFSLPAGRFKSRTLLQWGNSADCTACSFKDHLGNLVAAVSFKIMSSFISFSSLPDCLTKATRQL